MQTSDVDATSDNAESSDAFCVTPLKRPLPRAPIDLARRGAWSAETTHAPRVPDVAVAAHRRAQPISKTFSREVTSARACDGQPRQHCMITPGARWT